MKVTKLEIDWQIDQEVTDNMITDIIEFICDAFEPDGVSSQTFERNEDG